MGAGIAYQYTHHVIVDYYDLTEQQDDNGNTLDWDDEDYCEDLVREDWDFFKSEVAAVFNAEEISEISDGHKSYLFAETDRLYIGIDYSGADSSPCVYLKPKSYERIRHDKYGWEFYKDFEYNINRDAERGFNRLIKLYGHLIHYWTSGYTSKSYGLQKDGSYTRYGRKGE